MKLGMKFSVSELLEGLQNKPDSKIRGSEMEEEKKNAEEIRNTQMGF